ncbi:serine acetyltransferase [Mucilaginibacter sp. OK283]|jgi:serine acetyltransferase|uniref:serine acetyltransferase n=1 Tax=Mucilaginibacter sp. OK283 TaxID=1881049 RepID=UPI0008B0D6A1|nr:hypothetical protein [Mucilaginibacter sp. OK283]SEO46110.1 putative colanic acid biosynthesis acetyltransferase WcaB [Mucilaginibacter sp. OK283]
MNAGLLEKLKADIVKAKETTRDRPVVVLFLIKKSVRIVLLYRVLNHFYYKNRFVYYLLTPIGIYYRLMTNRYCIDLPVKTRIGKGLKLNHAYSIVVNQRTVIGENVYLGHNITIGSNGNQIPSIGNNVEVFTGSIIVGNVTIGDNVKVGAGSLVIKSIPANSIVVSAPCTLLKQS